VRSIGDLHLVSLPRIGATSILDTQELAVFQYLVTSGSDLDSAAAMFRHWGDSEEEARKRVFALCWLIDTDGWYRTEIKPARKTLLDSVFLTLTRRCNLKCQYCYQGKAVPRTDMDMATVERAIQHVLEVTPDGSFVLSGGEPMLHPRFFEILDKIEESGLTFSMITNATRIGVEEAERLAGYSSLNVIQISLDGLTAETQALTRRTGHEETMQGIRNVAAQGILFTLTPTMHDQNLHEMEGIARLAVTLGGSFKLNPMRPTPMMPNNPLTLDSSAAYLEMRKVGKNLVEEFGQRNVLETLSVRREREERERNEPSEPAPELPFEERERPGSWSAKICGIGRSVMDIDWNGDVYACNMLKGPELVLGNIGDKNLHELMGVVDERGYRVETPKIEKCSTCDFVTKCDGGCRASTYFNNGSFSKEDDFCGEMYNHRLYETLRNTYFRLGRQPPEGLHLMTAPVESDLHGRGRLRVLSSSPASPLRHAGDGGSIIDQVTAAMYGKSQH